MGGHVVVNRSTFVVRRSSFVLGIALALALTFGVARSAAPQTPAAPPSLDQHPSSDDGPIRSAEGAKAGSPQPLPDLTQPVNDFANVVDPQSAAAMERMIRALQEKSGDVVVVATVPSIAPYGTLKDYAVKLFENHGQGIGQRGKDNGVLIVVAPNERRVEVEVGYDLEQWITDGFAGDASRAMAPEFRNGNYGAGLLAGTERIIGRIAQGRNVTLDGVRTPQRTNTPRGSGSSRGGSALFWIVIAFLIISRMGGGGGGRRRGLWGRGGGWSSGVGPFGGGFGGGGFGGGGGGFGGGFGGFGGGRSGGGGGGGSW